MTIEKMGLSPIDVRDYTDNGDDIQRRFRYQSAYTVLKSLYLLEADSEYEEIYCEQFDDILVKLKGENKYIAIQVKTRLESKTPFKTNDEEIIGSLIRFIRLNIKFPDMFVRFVLATNSGFWQEIKTDYNNLAYILNTIKSRDIQSEPNITRLIKQISNVEGFIEEEIFSALKKVVLEDNLPKFDDIQMSITKELNNMGICKELSFKECDLISSALIDLMYRASSLSESSQMRYYFVLKEKCEKIKEATVIEGKRIDKYKLLEFIKKFNYKKYKHLKESIPQTKLLIGRDSEIEQLSEGFSKYNTIQVGGISGIGKTSVVAKFVKLIQNDTLWISFKSVNNIDLFFLKVADYLFSLHEDSKLLNIIENPAFSDEYKIKITVQLLEHYGTCLVIDGLDNDNYSFSRFLEECNMYFQNAKLIITTKQSLKMCKFNNPIFPFNLNRLDTPYGVLLLKKYLKSTIYEGLDDEILEIIVNKVNGHPYFIKFVAELANSVSLTSLLDEFSNLTTEEIHSYISSKILEGLTNTEKNLLVNLSIFRIPFKIAVVRFLLGDVNVYKEFITLVNKFLISNSFEGHYEIHDTIVEYLYSHIPDRELKDIHKKAVNYYISLEDRVVNESIELVFHAIESDQVELAKNESEKFLGKLMSIGYFDIAYRLAEELLEKEITKSWGHLYYTIGRVLRFKSEIQKALDIFRKGISQGITDKYKDAIKHEYASMLIIISKGSEGDEYFKEGVRIQKELVSSPDEKISISARLSIAHVQIETGHIEGLNELENLVPELTLVK